MNYRLLIATATLLAINLPQAASAASFTKFTDRAAFLGATGSLGNEDFNEIASDTVIGSGLDFGAFKLIDQRKSNTPGRSIVDAPPFSGDGFDGTSFVTLQAYESSTLSGYLVIEFSEAITAFAADWSSGNAGLISLKLLGLDLSQTVKPGGFFGFVSDTPFTRLEIHAQTGTGTSVAFDNISFSQAAVPEPATWGMMIAGLGIVGFSMRRRNAAVQFA